LFLDCHQSVTVADKQQKQMSINGIFNRFPSIHSFAVI